MTAWFRSRIIAPLSPIPLPQGRELLHAEGFTDVQYVNYPKDTQLWPPEDLLAGAVDITVSFTPRDIQFLDTGAPVAILGAAHTGCVELIANDHIRSTRDLKGKAVGMDLRFLNELKKELKT